MKIAIFNVETGEALERDLTSQELEELKTSTPPLIFPEPVTVVYSVDFWTRLDGGADGNSGEVAQVIEAMEQQSIQTRKIFETAQTFRSDHELWPLLVQLATLLFGEERTSEILKSSY